MSSAVDGEWNGRIYVITLMLAADNIIMRRNAFPRMLRIKGDPN